MRFPKRSIIAAFHDVAMAAISLPLALYLRLGNDVIALSKPYVMEAWLTFMACFVLSVTAFKLHKEVWRYVSLKELQTILKVVSFSIFLTYGALFFFFRLELVPRSLPVLQWMLMMVMLGAPRVIYRMLCESGRNTASSGRAKVAVLLAGAGNHAEGFIRAMQRDTDAPYQIVGILDEDKRRHGRSLRGIPIFSSLNDMEQVIGSLDAQGNKPQRLILSDDYMDKNTVQSLLDLCESQGLNLARLPRLTDFTSGAQTDIKPVAIEDLLGRAQSHHDRDAMRALVKDKRVLVTGAGGSIGSELVRQIARFAPEQLILLDHSEFNLYDIDKELERKLPHLPRLPLLCDIRNQSHVDIIFEDTKPDIVFHAAALKHVPLAEINPEETIATNVFGTRNVAESAIRIGAEAMVIVSTDKAVHPANVMGASKRLSEMVCSTISEDSNTRMVMVRFGNVLGSRGSVVPLFEEQMRDGGPLTVTHPDMERYFMTIREASGLVIQAAALGADATSLYILDMGEPVKIVDLAEQMVRLAGHTPHEDIKITFTGLRPGEKLTEELVYTHEALQPTEHPRVNVSGQSADAPLDFRLLDDLQHACASHNEDAARRLLQELVTEYQPNHYKDAS